MEPWKISGPEEFQLPSPNPTSKRQDRGKDLSDKILVQIQEKLTTLRETLSSREEILEISHRLQIPHQDILAVECRDKSDLLMRVLGAYRQKIISCRNHSLPQNIKHKHIEADILLLIIYGICTVAVKQEWITENQKVEYLNTCLLSRTGSEVELAAKKSQIKALKNGILLIQRCLPVLGVRAYALPLLSGWMSICNEYTKACQHNFDVRLSRLYSCVELPHLQYIDFTIYIKKSITACGQEISIGDICSIIFPSRMPLPQLFKLSSNCTKMKPEAAPYGVMDLRLSESHPKDISIHAEEAPVDVWNETQVNNGLYYRRVSEEYWPFITYILENELSIWRSWLSAQNLAVDVHGFSFRLLRSQAGSSFIAPTGCRGLAFSLMSHTVAVAVSRWGESRTKTKKTCFVEWNASEFLYFQDGEGIAAVEGSISYLYFEFHPVALAHES